MQPLTAALLCPVSSRAAIAPSPEGCSCGSDRGFFSSLQGLCVLAWALPALPSPEQRQRCSSAATNPATALFFPLLCPPLFSSSCHDRPPSALNPYLFPGWFSSLFYKNTPLASLSSYPSNTGPPASILTLYYYKAQLLQPGFHHVTFSSALNTPPAPLVHCLLLSAACTGLFLFPFCYTVIHYHLFEAALQNM